MNWRCNPFSHRNESDDMTKKPAAKSAKPAAAAARTGASASGVDAGLVRELAGLLSETDLTEIEVEKGDLRIRVARETRYAVAAPAPVTLAAPASAPAPVMAAAAPAAAPASHPGAVKSPMVGTAYRRPNPESNPFVDVGSVVKSGDKLLLVEAMKTFNEIVAPKGGVITAIFVEDGQPVEYDQTLVIIE
jgi:acetyl-CoA carboxylase biotin carboxyl carrier protein